MLMVYLPLVIARWIHFASVFVLFGSSFFWFYEGAERSSAGPGGLPRAVRATTILLRIAAPIAAISGIAWLACILINIARDFHSVVDPEDLRLFDPPRSDDLRRKLARLGIGLERRRRQLQGDDIDIDAVVESRVEMLAGSTPDEGLYVESQRRRRSLAVQTVQSYSSPGVLDVGCGSGRIGELVLQAGAAR